jgi:hypothetical protein
MDLETFRSVNSRMPYVAYHPGDYDEAIERARASQHPFALAVAERLERSRTGRRAVLPFPYRASLHGDAAAARRHLQRLWF